MKSLSITTKMGSDTFSKLEILLKKNHALTRGKMPKSGETIDATISYCIELAYHAFLQYRSCDGMPDCIVLPETIKAEKLYYIYQQVKTMSDGGMSPVSIANRMTGQQMLTADDLYLVRALKHTKPTRWTKEDVQHVLNTDALNVLMRELNGRQQRKTSHKCASTTT